MDISAEARRIWNEKPYGWEYKFFAFLLKSEYDKLQEQRWNLQYGFHGEKIVSMEASEVLSEITRKMKEMKELIKNIGVLFNETYPDAIGSGGESIDLERLHYIAKQFSSFYEQMISCGLYFKAIQTDNIFSQLLQLLYEFSKSVLQQMDTFVTEMCEGIMAIPDVSDGKKRQLKFVLEIKVDTEAMDKEIENLIMERYRFRHIKPNEIEQAVAIEQICFPPHEACSEKNMRDRIAVAPELFLVAEDKETGLLAGFLNGIATDEQVFRDEFFTDASLHNPDGKNIMLLGLDVLPEYRMQGLARELVFRYIEEQQKRGRHALFLTCLDAKVEMYTKFGFVDHGLANSSWGGEEWHEMSVVLSDCGIKE